MFQHLHDLHRLLRRPCNMSEEELLSEYLLFLPNLPDIILSEKRKIIDTVKNEWNIDKLLKNVENLKFEKKLVNKGEGGHLLDQLGIKTGRSLRVLCPPVKKCLLCDGALATNNAPIQIVVHTLNGPKMYSKYILRCKNCRLTSKQKFKDTEDKLRQDIYYHPDMVGKLFLIV